MPKSPAEHLVEPIGFTRIDMRSYARKMVSNQAVRNRRGGAGL